MLIFSVVQLSHYTQGGLSAELRSTFGGCQNSMIHHKSPTSQSGERDILSQSKGDWKLLQNLLHDDRTVFNVLSLTSSQAGNLASGGGLCQLTNDRIVRSTLSTASCRSGWPSPPLLLEGIAKIRASRSPAPAFATILN